MDIIHDTPSSLIRVLNVRQRAASCSSRPTCVTIRWSQLVHVGVYCTCHHRSRSRPLSRFWRLNEDRAMHVLKTWFTMLCCATTDAPDSSMTSTVVSWLICILDTAALHCSPVYGATWSTCRLRQTSLQRRSARKCDHISPLPCDLRSADTVADRVAVWNWPQCQFTQFTRYVAVVSRRKTSTTDADLSSIDTCDDAFLVTKKKKKKKKKVQWFKVRSKTD